MGNLSNYQILKLVATGGTAVLYKAVQTSLDRVVAIKRLHQHLTEDENFTRRFVLEAKAAASLDHDNIVKIIDFGIEDDGYHIVMEFIEGESLRDILDRWRYLPVDLSLALVHQVLLGLEHAHAKGIVHRDIKPGNVMLTRAGRVKITDFGLAKLTQTTTQHTAANSILGTPLYMSPEQAFGESVDHRSDLFSLGTLLYEMVTGVQPFRGENYMGVIQNIIHRNVPHPSKFNVDTPPQVQSMLLKALNKNRDQRFQSAADFRRAIERYLGFESLNTATENLRGLLNTDGETVMLSAAEREATRRQGVRRGFVGALVASLLLGAAAWGYSFAPEAIERQMQSVAEWLGNVRRDLPVPVQQQSGLVADGMDAIVTFSGDSASGNPPAPDPVGNLPPAPTLITIRDTIVIRERDTTSTQAAQEPQPAPVSEPEPQAVVQTGWLSVRVEPWGEVWVDGVYRGDAPPARRVELTRGTHTLECRNPKCETYRESVRITQGEMSTRSVVLKKLVAQISLTTTEGAEVYVDGSLIGVTPLRRPIEVEAGSHLITVKKAGYNIWNNEITVSAKQVLPLRITLSPIY